jgi:hypothetical protein
MTTKLDELLPTANDFMKKLALAEAEAASKEAAKRAAAETEKKALLDQFTKPSGVSDEEAIRRAIKIIERAVSNGRTEVQVHRFPNQLCTDKGRAIIQQEAGGKHADRRTKGDLSALGEVLPSPRLQAQGRNRRLSRRVARRCRHDTKVGLNRLGDRRTGSGPIL